MMFSIYVDILLLWLYYWFLNNSVEGVKQINVQLSISKREILKGLYEYYKKEHKYHGQA